MATIQKTFVAESLSSVEEHSIAYDKYLCDVPLSKQKCLGIPESQRGGSQTGHKWSGTTLFI